MIYVTADLHFSHDKIIRHCNRPFREANEMNEKIIQSWNSLVKPEDEVYVLGDVTMKGPDQAFSFLSRLMGKKYLVKGNHDYFVDNNEWRQYSWVFEWVKDYHEMTVDNQVFVLCHYPFAEWNQQRRGSIHLHGHQHNHSDYNLRQRKEGLWRYDVGVDANGFVPVPLNKIVSFFYQGKMSARNKDAMFWMTNDDWYIIDKKNNQFILTDKAPKEAYRSFEKYKEINNLTW